MGILEDIMWYSDRPRWQAILIAVFAVPPVLFVLWLMWVWDTVCDRTDDQLEKEAKEGR